MPQRNFTFRRKPNLEPLGFGVVSVAQPSIIIPGVALQLEHVDQFETFGSNSALSHTSLSTFCEIGHRRSA